MRSLGTLLLLLVLPGLVAAQSGGESARGDSAPADPGRRMAEDIEIMRRLLQRTVQSLGAASRFGSLDRSGVSGHVYRYLDLTPDAFGLGYGTDSVYYDRAAGAPVEGSYLKGYGAVFTVTLPSWLATESAKAAAPADKPLSEWERTRRELRGEPAPPAPPTTQTKRPDLVAALLKCLADNGRHFAHLQAHEKLTVAVTFRDASEPHISPFGAYPANVDPERKQSDDQPAPKNGDPTPADVSNTALALAALAAAGQTTTAKDYELLGDLQAKEGKLKEAIQAYLNALERDPPQPQLNQLYAKLAKAYLSLERPSNEQRYRNAVQQALKWLQKVQDDKTAAAQPPRREPPLPTRLTLSVTKKMLDAVATGDVSADEFRRSAALEWQRFPLISGQAEPKK